MLQWTATGSVKASDKLWRYKPFPRPNHLPRIDRPVLLNFYMHHGRIKRSEQMDDWGFQGPTLKNCIGTHTTYLDDLYIIFADTEAAEVAQKQTGWEMWDNDRLLARIIDDMLFADGAYYGDWGLIAP